MTVSEAPAETDADIGVLFERYADELHRYLDDLVGDTFVAALRGEFDARRGSARTWLYGIATNLANNHVRRRGREEAATGRLIPQDQADSHESRVVDRVDAQVRAAQLRVAIADLAAADRDVLLLSSWAGLSNQEIAEALGVPAGTVRSRLHRVRRHLRSVAPTVAVNDEDETDNVD